MTLPTEELASEDARAMEQELRALRGEQLVASSGKLAVLDCVVSKHLATGSRFLVFSQFTQTLDVLEEWAIARFTAAAYFRLDGSTNRIAREMDVREFNAAGSPTLLYLISTRERAVSTTFLSFSRVVVF